jgi:hypothetical protein
VRLDMLCDFEQIDWLKRNIRGGCSFVSERYVTAGIDKKTGEDVQMFLLDGE